MKVLVLGGNGFIGAHIVERLVQDGHDVSVLDKYKEKYRDPLPQVQYWFGSFDDRSLLTKALANVDLVFHLVSTTVPGTSNLDVETDVKDNLLGTLGLLELMRKQEVKKIIFLSSGGAVYGNPKTNPVPEEIPLNPISSYGINKMAIEKYLYLYQHLHGIEAIVLRPSNPYGPFQSTAGIQGVIARFLYQALHSRPIEIWGDGEVIRDYIYIDDFVELCEKATQRFLPGVYNVGSGEGASINLIAQLVEQTAGKDIEIIRKPGRPSDVKAIVLDCQKAESVWEWSANTTLQAGIAKQWAWMQEALRKGTPS